MEIKVYPFSFMEYLTYYEITDGYDDAFDQYVRTGGMPGAYVYKTEDRQYDYVRDVYSTILVRDLVEKYKIRNKSEFTNISEFMMDNIGNLLSPNNISKTLNNDRSEITRKTVSKYIGYLENAFLFYEAKRYDLKGKKYLANNSKYYLCDSSFRYAVNGTRNMDLGRVYENIVYLELRRRGYEVYVGKLYKREVDFVAKKRETQIYIQVSDNISDEKIFEREHSPLLAIRDAYPKMIIARTHHETYDYQGVQVVDICNDTYQNEQAAQSAVAVIDAALESVRASGGGLDEALAAVDEALPADAQRDGSRVLMTFASPSGRTLDVELTITANATYEISQWKATTQWTNDGPGATLWSGAAQTR